MEQQKHKISARKILQLTVTLIVTTSCVLAIMSASKIQDKKMVQAIQIHISNEKACQFFNKKQVEDILLNSRHVQLNHTSVSTLDVHTMEQILLSNPWIETANAYVDNTATLHIVVVQRIPVLRVFEQSGNSYYLDKNGKSMPLSDDYTAYTHVVTNVPVLYDDSSSNSLKMQMLALASIIKSDSFWSAQTAQIYMTDNKTFDLIPILGNQKIILGDTSRLKEKLDNVFAFYKGILNKIGWNTYQTIDASFGGQIIASPAIKWNVPKDKAMSDMNWVKAVMGNASGESDIPVAENELTQKTAASDKKTVTVSVKSALPKQTQAVHTTIISKEKNKAKNTSTNKKAELKPKYLYGQSNH